MPKRNENLTAIFAIAAVFAIGVILILNVFYYRSAGVPFLPSTASKGNITLTASGSVSASPDQAAVYINLNSTGRNASSATVNLTASLAELNSTLSKFIMINSTTIQTMSYSLYRVQNSSSYAAHERVQLTLPLNVTPAILGSLPSVSGISISGFNMQLSAEKISSLRATALAIAMQNATTQAQIIAGVYGPVHLTNVVVNGGNTFYPGAYAQNAASNVEIFPGTASVTESVTATFSYG